MTRRRLPLLAPLLLASAPALAADAPLRLWYEKPAATWVEALPIGNGRLGAMVFGDPRRERLALNEDTLWSGGPTEWNNPDAKAWLPKVREAVFAGRYVEADALTKKMQGPFNQSYQPLGDVLVDFDVPGPVGGNEAASIAETFRILSSCGFDPARDRELFVALELMIAGSTFDARPLPHPEPELATAAGGSRM